MASTLLIVDDDPDLLIALPDTIALRVKDLRVLTAVDAHKAVDVVKTAHPDIVLTDLIMPGANGAWLLEALLHVQPPPVTLLMSAHLDAKDLLQGRGAFAFVPKPIDREFLAETLHRAMRVARARRQAYRTASLVGETAAEAHRVLAAGKDQMERLRDTLQAWRDKKQD